ncbi:hypothetical protein N8T08_009670 [Aspergillus melleus]|uniref:Uncharacterized protein n=1 Tax=Aspergillus melleus TaxID=138277 RepID=A0ACC3ATC1_9EURO|nr:hypothetical protein N8T08_009670 [Aspergillus melleus]
MVLRGHTELMVECKRLAEAYKNVEAMAALYRRELEELRKEFNELHKEVASLKELIQSLSLATPTMSPGTQARSPGRSWASLVSQSSVASSNTRAGRTGLSLPAVILDLRSAGEETKKLVDDSALAREKIRAALHNDTSTAGIGIMGVKPTSKTTIKVFVDSEESVTNLRRATHWLNAMPGARLQGEQWFPIKLNDGKREGIFETSGAQQESFLNALQEENEVAEMKKIVWLSGEKRYGSLAIDFARQADAEALLSRRIVHVHGKPHSRTDSMSDSTAALP